MTAQLTQSASHKIKVALGMSGGVDSSLAAHLLVEQGYDVTGVYLECWRAPGCRTDQDRKDALEVALKLGIPYQVLDFKQQYRDSVVQYFFDEYQAGRTPNPDVLCNKEIKFGLFYNWAMDQGFDYVATGHYAALSHKGSKTKLIIPADQHKDQTYFLYLLTQQQLKHTLFPLQGLTKPQVREEATKRKIHVSDKKDSVGICFIGDINVKELLTEQLGTNPGEVIDVDGNVIGQHQGLWFYTVGQRHGFEITTTSTIQLEDGTSIERTNLPPFYVIKKLPQTNQLVVGFGQQTYQSTFNVEAPHWIDQTQPTDLSNLLVRIRHTGELQPGSLTFANDEWQVSLVNQTKGIAAGQSAVFYQETNGQVVCLGGAVIL
jgi:tRNA-uridine 2-sulfurtransferase